MKKIYLFLMVQFCLTAILFSAKLGSIIETNFNLSENIFIKDNLNIIFFDVDQGDAELIITPEKKVFLIDSGNWGASEFVIIPILKKLNISQIDKLIITHPHGDHHGGALYLLQNFKILEFLDAGIPSTEDKYTDVLECIKTKNIKYTIPATEEKIYSEPNLEIICLQNNEKKLKDLTLNDNSMVVMLHYKNFKVIFAADIEELGEDFLVVNSKFDLKSDVLKIPHHGSNTSSTDDFVEKISPEIGIIMVGYKNTFYHPAKTTLEKYENIETKLFRTDYNGHILISTNGEDYNVFTQYKNRYNNKKVNDMTDEAWSYLNDNEDTETAFSLLKDALQLEPDNPAVCSLLGFAFFCDKQYIEAESYLKKAIELNPQEYYGRINLSTIYEIRNDFKTALEYLEEASHLERHGRDMTEILKKIEVLKGKVK